MKGQKEPPFKYWAFLSYSHADARWSHWLHRRLETYRVPRKLVGRSTERGYQVPARLYPVFRDREELPSSASLNDAIRVALRQSGYLIVICSPRSAASLWVNEEIRSFKAMGREDRVLCLLVDGEPNATEKKCGFPEAFPEALRYRINSRGEVTGERVEPIAADARPKKDGRHAAFLKLAAGVLGVGFNDLRLRERARRNRRRALRITAATVLIGLGLLGWRGQEARRARSLQEMQSLSDWSTGMEQVGRQDMFNGPLSLARAVRSNRQLRPAALGLWDLLQNHHFALPASEFMTHDAEIIALDISPDGSKIATGSHDGTARIWEATSGKPLTAPLGYASAVHGIAFTNPVHGVAFSPDGGRLLTIGGWHLNEGGVMVWDAASGEPLAGPMTHGDFIFSAEFSPDGERLVTAAADKTVKVWDSRTGRLLFPPMTQPGNVEASFDPTGRRIVTSDLPSEFRGAGAVLVTAESDTTLRIVEARTGVDRRVLTHPDKVVRAESDPEGALLATACRDGWVRIWDMRSGRLVVEPFRTEGEVGAMKWSRDGTSIIVANGLRNQAGTARRWIINRAAPPGDVMEMPEGHLASWSPDGSTLAIASGSNESGEISFWDPKTRRRLREAVRVSGRIQALRFSPDGKRLLAATGFCGQAGAIYLFDARTGSAVTPPIEYLQGAMQATFSPDGAKIASASCGGAARVWSAENGEALTRILAHGDRVNSVDFSPDGLRLLTSSGAPVFGKVSEIADAFLQNNVPRPETPVDAAWIWDAETGGLLVGPIQLPNSARIARFSPDGQRFVTACGSQFRGGEAQARVWDARSGAPVSAEMKLAGSAEWAEFSPDGTRVLTAYSDGSSTGVAQVWDAHTGTAVGKPMMHAGPIRSAHFSPDGFWVVTASSDGTARIWEGRSGRPVTCPWGHTGSADVAEFSPDGLAVVTGGPQQKVRLWDVSVPLVHGSFEYLADVMEAVIGARLAVSGKATAAGWTLDSIVQDQVLLRLFSAQLTPWRGDRSRSVNSASVTLKNP